MEKLLIDENGEYGLDCTQAVWASDKMHEDYHRAKVQLSDADFLLEEVNNILIVEYKNADTKYKGCPYKRRPAFHLLLQRQRGILPSNTKRA